MFCGDSFLLQTYVMLAYVLIDLRGYVFTFVDHDEHVVCKLGFLYTLLVYLLRPIV